MYFLGHLGIGLKIVQPWSRGLSRRLILLGAILPDLIDKPVYYVLSWTTGLRGAELGMIAGTRGFAHTALFLLVFATAAIVRRSRALTALSLGIGTHLLLDSLTDRILHGDDFSLNPLLWPALGRQFPAYPYHGLAEHLMQFKEPFLLWAEVIGALILVWELWKNKNKDGIVAYLRKKRGERRTRRQYNA